MERYRKHRRESRSADGFNPDSQYELAYKRVKRIKGFYIHALVFVLVNGFNIISNIDLNSEHKEYFWNWKAFSIPLFWGIGLLAHGLSVFGQNMFFGANWEQKKIQELMDKDKNQKWE